MPAVHFSGRDFPVQPGESVLDCLLRNGVPVPHSCKAGACQSCLVRGIPGEVPEAAQNGLKDTLRAQGYFLACACRPAADLEVSLAGAEQRIAAHIAGIESLNETVVRVRLRTQAGLTYNAGQFVTLIREDGLARSYSLASLPHEDELELHVRKIHGGAMSQWLHQQSVSGTPVWLQGPSGNCFYVAGMPEQPLLLAGAGTGLAPLFGIVRDALLQGHTGEIWLFHGALVTAGLYLTRELIELSCLYPNFHYVRSVLHGGGTGVDTGELSQSILSRFPKLNGWKGYICGDPALVNTLRKRVFLAGMASKSIYADPFVPSAQ
jgi:CDP-4-dehydro-6-deoxyglucose reductase